MSLGSDFAGVDDIDRNLAFLEGEGPEVIAYLQAIAARLLSDVGSLEYSPTYGRGLFRYLSGTTSAPQIAADIVATCLDDERTDNATATTSPTDEGLDVEVTLYVRGGATYPLTVSLDKLKASIEVSTGAIVLVRV